MLMRPRAQALFAIVASLLLVSVAPGAAASSGGELVVGSEHTDFGTDSEASPQKLTNLTIEGTGDSATVSLSESNTFSDSFENELADSGTPDNWELTTSSGSEEVNTTYATDGSKAYRIKEPGDGGGGHRTRPSEQPYGSAISENISVSIKQSNTIGSPAQSLLNLKEGGNFIFRVGIRDGDLQYYDGSWNTLATGFGDAWVDITVNPDPSAGSFTVSWNSTSGSGSVSGLTGETAMANGFTTTQLSTYQATTFHDEFQIGGGDLSSAMYVGAQHNVTDPQQAAINITKLSNVSVNVTVRTDGGTVLNRTMITSTGNHTVALSSTSSSHLETVLEVNVTGVNPKFRLAEESILFPNHLPGGNNLTPVNGSEVKSSDVRFSIDVSDPEFGKAQGDSVTAKLYIDGEFADSKTVSSNTTVNITHTVGEGGNHSYYWKLTDSYGSSTKTANMSFKSPATLAIYNESTPSELVNNVTVELKMYVGESESPKVYEMNTSDGTIDMSGIPANESFIVVAEAEGYYSRRIFVTSLYEQQKVFLLPSNETVSDTIFAIEDYSGAFPPEDSVLLVQRALNGSYRTVLGDFFGATGQFPAQLANNERHRLVLLNVETGERRKLGTYTPISSSQQEVVVTPSGIIDVRSPAPIAQVRPQLDRLPALDASKLRFNLDNRSKSVSGLMVEVVVNNTTLLNQTYSSGGEITEELSLGGYAGENATVRIWWEDSNGSHLVTTQRYRIVETMDNDSSLLESLAQLASLPPPENQGDFTSFLAIFVTVMAIAGISTQLPIGGDAAGLAGLLLLTGFGVIGWVGYGLVFVSGVGVITFGALRRGL